MTDSTGGRSDRLRRLGDLGVSVWLDDLSRENLRSGALRTMMDEFAVVGVTTNPTIFASALGQGEAYDEQLDGLATSGASLDEAVLAVTTDDVREACDLFASVYAATGGQDGRVSIEVDPRLAHDTEATIEAARLLWRTVDRPNLMVKIPATQAGLPAITQAIGEGISVNVTLIFSLDRYRAVAGAYLDGLERAKAAGLDLSTIRSVASFFVSRVDSEVDKRLDAIGTEEAAELKGRAAVANARLAYEAYEQIFSTPRWEELAAAGAHTQRPLWASTGVKDPAYPDTLYVDELITTDVVNTMPEKTLRAVADHAEVRGDFKANDNAAEAGGGGRAPGRATTSRAGGGEETERSGTAMATYADARGVLDALERLGISYTEVTDLLEREGVEKFEASWGELLETVSGALESRRDTGAPDMEAGS